MTKLHRKTSDGRLYAPAEDAFLPSAQSERERDMAQFDIGFDGLRYHRNGYRYDRLEDAVAYASLMSTRPGQEDTVGTFKQGKTLAWPTDAEQALMASLGIRFDHGAYRFEDFRYDQLSDAVNYAKLALQRKKEH
jgi:hypothetical protein